MRNDILSNYEFASNQIASFFMNKYFKGIEWFWYRDYTSGILQFKGTDTWYSIEDMLTYLKYRATKKQITGYEEYCDETSDPVIFKIYKEQR